MTEQSLMITTNKQPCNNQRQNLEVTHQYYLDSSEYELKMAKSMLIHTKSHYNLLTRNTSTNTSQE